MSDTFEQKLQTLSSKLQNMERPCSLIQRQSKCKDSFLDIRKKISQKFEIVEKELKNIEQNVQNYQCKIQHTKHTINNFSCSKHSQLKQIIQNWVDTFHQKLKTAKQSLKSYQVATQVKINQIQKENQVLLSKIQDKISKNLKKIDNSIQSISNKCQQQREHLKKEFEANRNNILKLALQKEQIQTSMDKAIHQKLFEIQMKINTQIQLLSQKWTKKDEKTRKIFELLVQEDM